MSDEQRNEETEVEAHQTGSHASDEPRDEAEDEGHASRVNRPGALSANDEPGDEAEVEGHAWRLDGPAARRG